MATKRLFSVIIFIFFLVTAPATVNAKDYRARFQAYAASATAINSLNHQEFCQDVTKRTNNQLKIDFYVAGTLGYSGFEHHRVVGDGLLEIGETTAAAITEEPLFGILSQPMLFNDITDAKKAWELIKNDLNESAKNFNAKILMATTRSPDMWNTTKPLPTVESFKGTKLRAWNPILSDWVEAMGGTPQVIPYAERHQSLATGVVEGNAAAPISVLDTKDYEVAKYYCLWPLQPPFYITFINIDFYNSLPKNLQEIIFEEAKKSEEKLWKKYMDASKTEMLDLKNLGVKIVAPSLEELKKARQITEEKIWKPWREKAGPEATALLDRVKKALGYN
jgi:TRAP-type C4-dicarboxylate transport system substrate-binding protein